MAIRGTSNIAPLIPASDKIDQPTVNGTSALAPLEGIIESPDTAIVIKVEPKDVHELFTLDHALTPILTEIATKARSIVADVSTKKGRDTIASVAYQVARAKTYLDDQGKELVTGLKDLPRKVDANRKAMRDFLDALKDDVRAPLTAWEAEQDRQKRFCEDIKLRPFALQDAGSKQIQAAIVDLTNLALAVSPDFLTMAQASRGEALASMGQMLEKRLTQEREAAELVRLREEAKIREQQEAEAQRIREATERATREAREAQERAEREKTEAEQRVKDAEAREARLKAEAAEREEQARILATQAEQRRQEEAQRKAKAEQDAREADIEHRRTFNREAWADVQAVLLAGKDGDIEGTATDILTAIIKGQVRHITIHY